MTEQVKSIAVPGLSWDGKPEVSTVVISRDTAASKHWFEISRCDGNGVALDLAFAYTKQGARKLAKQFVRMARADYRAREADRKDFEDSGQVA